MTEHQAQEISDDFLPAIKKLGEIAPQHHQRKYPGNQDTGHSLSDVQVSPVPRVRNDSTVPSRSMFRTARQGEPAPASAMGFAGMTVELASAAEKSANPQLTPSAVTTSKAHSGTG